MGSISNASNTVQAQTHLPATYFISAACAACKGKHPVQYVPIAENFSAFALAVCGLQVYAFGHSAWRVLAVCSRFPPWQLRRFRIVFSPGSLDENIRVEFGSQNRHFPFTMTHTGLHKFDPKNGFSALV